MSDRWVLCKQTPGEPDIFIVDRIISQQEWDVMLREPPEGIIVGEFLPELWNGVYGSAD